jgi:hypothetical protein
MDISETGCLLRISAKDAQVLKSSDDFYLTFKILNARMELECVVRNTRYVGEQLLHGVSFTRTSPMDRENILSLIDLIRSRGDE